MIPFRKYSDDSNSDSDLDDNEKQLLNKVRNKKVEYSDSEDEVLGVDVSDGDQSDLAVSDVEGQDDDDIPNVHAWGRDKRNFYSTDYVDPDYGGYQGKDAALADQEEEEAANLHKELAQKLDENVFFLDIDEKKVEHKQIEEIEETDISKLSKRQKIQLLEKESPEFFGLIEEYKVRSLLAKEYLNPIMDLNKCGKISNSDAVLFVSSYQHLIQNYTMNIIFYLLLKASRVNVLHHPVIRRLNQYRHLINQMEPVFEEIIKPQIDILLEQNHNDVLVAETESKSKKVVDLIKKLQSGANPKKLDSSGNNIEPSKKKFKKLESAENKKWKGVQFETDSDTSEEEPENEENVVDEIEGDADERRPITYQIAKNKGLTPHRKKEQRNPRVKYKNKFRKANIRRKGAIRTVRTESTRYGGEISGIKASVSKSIKIKS